MPQLVLAVSDMLYWLLVATLTDTPIRPAIVMVSSADPLLCDRVSV